MGVCDRDRRGIGCLQVGTELQTPRDACQRFLEGAARHDQSIANMAWWVLLKDPELQTLIRIALDENQDLRTAVTNVDQYRAQLVITRWDLAPSLGYSGHAFLFQASGTAATVPTGGPAPIVLPQSEGRGGSTTFSNKVVLRI